MPDDSRPLANTPSGSDGRTDYALRLPCPEYPLCRLDDEHDGDHMTPWRRDVSFAWKGTA